MGAGSTLYLGMYGLLLGAYWPAARVATEMPALLETANETAVAIFILSNVPINAGIALAFFVEARHETRNWWKRFAWLACVLAAVGAIVSAYTLAIDGGMAVALSVAPVGGVLFILLSVFGASFAIEE